MTARQVGEQLDPLISAVRAHRVGRGAVTKAATRRAPPQWSGAELIVALDRALTMSQAAKQLDRTVGRCVQRVTIYCHENDLKPA